MSVIKMWRCPLCFAVEVFTARMKPSMRYGRCQVCGQSLSYRGPVRHYARLPKNALTEVTMRLGGPVALWHLAADKGWVAR